jgi:hypothetical protein
MHKKNTLLAAMPDQYDYLYQEWRDQFAFFSQAGIRSKEGEATDPIQLSYEYFPSQYSDQEEAEYKRRRFVKAMIWYERYSSDFDYGKVSVESTTERLTGNAIVISLWRLFSAIPEELLDTEPTVEQAKQVVDEETKRLTIRGRERRGDRLS